MAPINVNDLIGLETDVWNALVEGDAEKDTQLLAEDFLGVYPSGFASRQDHAGQLANGPTTATFEITEPRVFELSDSAAMLSYRAIFRRVTSSGPGEEEVMYVSSLWRHRDGAWVNIFSQDTPAAD